MPSRRQKDIFQELGLLAEARQPNPLAALGIRSELARDLLAEDPSGQALRTVAGALGRMVSRYYHSDTNQKPESRKRFEEITAARQAIGEAEPTALRRWLEAPAPQASGSGPQQQRQLAVVNRAAELVQQNMALGGHPLHFSQARWSQGVLLRRRAGGSLLLREYPDDTISVQPATKPLFDAKLATTSFQEFLRSRGSFGLEAGTKVTTYIDDQGRASMLTPQLGYMMDITNAVAEHREETEADGAEFASWDNSPYPLLIASSMPGQGFGRSAAETRMTSFPHESRTGSGAADMAWDIPLHIAGTLQDAEYFRRARSSRPVGAVAIQGAESAPAARYFGVLATSAVELITREAGYSPLIEPQHSLLLYDGASGMPVATDATVIGMLGNGPQG